MLPATLGKTTSHPGRARGESCHTLASAHFEGTVCRIHFSLRCYLRREERGAGLSRFI